MRLSHDPAWTDAVVEGYLRNRDLAGMHALLLLLHNTDYQSLNFVGSVADMYENYLGLQMKLRAVNI